MHKINHADIKQWAANYNGELFDGILCDPPYHLVSMAKRYGKPGSAEAKSNRSGGNDGFQGVNKGFMGKEWDGVDENGIGIAQDPEMWRLLFNLLKPGAHLLAFSGSRTYHRMAVAIEDAGFEIRDMIEWIYGSGFPKSLNIGLAIDKQNGVIGNRGTAINMSGKGEREDIKTSVSKANGTLQAGYTNAQNDWNGYGTALKPAHEPCVLARKPLEGTVAQNVLKHGTGGLNIDGTRVETSDKYSYPNGAGGNSFSVGEEPDGKRTEPVKSNVLGRFPANLIHDGSDEVEAVFPQTKSGKVGIRTSDGFNANAYGKGMGIKAGQDNGEYGDKGSASRFFYTAKSSKSERNAGLEGFEDKERINYGGFHSEKGLVENNRNPENRVPMKNHHPTVKPLSLTKYLATLIKPPTGGRLLVPFSGSGSEMIGALQVGWEYVEGVELTEEYIPIAEARIEYWLNVKEEETKQMELV